MSAGSADLLEREGELRALADAIERAIAGEGSVVILEGPAGIGKTRLIGACTALAEAAGMRTLRAVGDEVVMESAFAAVRELLWPVVDGSHADLFAGAARLSEPVFRAAADGDAASGSETVMHGLYWVLAGLAESAARTGSSPARAAAWRKGRPGSGRTPGRPAARSLSESVARRQRSARRGAAGVRSPAPASCPVTWRGCARRWR